MRVNTKIRYGLRTMIEIANSKEPNGVLQKDISVNQNISLKYLDSIISSLKLKGIVSNSKGRGSGYRLTRPTSEITMYDIYTAFEPIEIIECINNNSFCDNWQNCKAKSYWDEFKTDFVELLSKRTLQHIIEETSTICTNPTHSDSPYFHPINP